MTLPPEAVAEAYALPDFHELITACAPEVLRDVVAVLYADIRVSEDGTLTYAPQGWCKEWA